MYRSALIATIWLGLPIQAAWSEDAIPLTNVTINMINRGGRGGYRIEAKIANPNDFAIFDLHVNCEIKDQRQTRQQPDGLCSDDTRCDPSRGNQNHSASRYWRLAGSRKDGPLCSSAAKRLPDQ